MFTVTWRGGIAVVEDGGRVRWAQSDTAIQEAEGVLSREHTRSILPDAIERLRPGTTAHTGYALSRLPDAFVTHR